MLNTEQVLNQWTLRVEISGQILITFSVMSLYLPSGTNLLRLDHKLNYMRMFKDYIDELKSSLNELIIAR